MKLSKIDITQPGPPQTVLPTNEIKDDLKNRVTATQAAVLQDILATSNKLNDTSRGVIVDYLNGEHFTDAEKKNFKENITVLIMETREKLDDQHIKVEQTKLKIDYKQTSIKKVKSVKRYKLNP